MSQAARKCADNAVERPVDVISVLQRKMPRADTTKQKTEQQENVMRSWNLRRDPGPVLNEAQPIYTFP
jgi:hypothetical protein